MPGREIREKPVSAPVSAGNETEEGWRRLHGIGVRSTPLRPGRVGGVTASTGEIERGLGQLLGAGSAVGLTDDELLARSIAADRLAAELAFETILGRCGAMVLTVRRQMLGGANAAEDAFQATFLVFLRRAGPLWQCEGGLLGSWLHGTAFHAAKKARRGLTRRQARERRAAVWRIRRGSGPDHDHERGATVCGAIDGAYPQHPRGCALAAPGPAADRVDQLRGSHAGVGVRPAIRGVPPAHLAAGAVSVLTEGRIAGVVWRTWGESGSPSGRSGGRIRIQPDSRRVG